MDDFQDKLNSVLSNPEMMQQIMSMAQALGGSQPDPSPSPESEKSPAAPTAAGFLPEGIDLSMLQKLSGFTSKIAVDSNQQGLLRALGPYLPSDRVHKLEKAMRAAKLARLATTLLSQSGGR